MNKTISWGLSLFTVLGFWYGQDNNISGLINLTATLQWTISLLAILICIVLLIVFFVLDESELEYTFATKKTHEQYDAMVNMYRVLQKDNYGMLYWASTVYGVFTFGIFAYYGWFLTAAIYAFAFLMTRLVKHVSRTTLLRALTTYWLKHKDEVDNPLTQE